MIKSKYRKLFQDLKATDFNKVLIVDGTNTFLRSVAANPVTNENGIHFGGTTGFLLSVGYAIKTLNVNEVIIVFDGKNGSARRKEIFSEYKANRNKPKKQRISKLYLNENHERDALKFQMKKLIRYLRLLPVKIFIADYMEADDVIAYITELYKPEINKIIMSTDHDFYQLINDNISVWSPTKKILYNKENFINEFEMQPENYLHYKVLNGDPSDNIKGIRGFGIKTAKKCFPLMFNEKIITPKEIVDHAKINKGKFKIYNTILDNLEDIKRNYKLIKLSTSYITANQKLILNEHLFNFKPYVLNRFEFMKSVIEDQINGSFKNPNRWIDNVWLKIK